MWHLCLPRHSVAENTTTENALWWPLPCSPRDSLETRRVIMIIQWLITFTYIRTEQRSWASACLVNQFKSIFNISFNIHLIERFGGSVKQMQNCDSCHTPPPLGVELSCQGDSREQQENKQTCWHKATVQKHAASTEASPLPLPFDSTGQESDFHPLATPCRISRS